VIGPITRGHSLQKLPCEYTEWEERDNSLLSRRRAVSARPRQDCPVVSRLLECRCSPLLNARELHRRDADHSAKPKLGRSLEELCRYHGWLGTSARAAAHMLEQTLAEVVQSEQAIDIALLH
jgi:hypothetical protein